MIGIFFAVVFATAAVFEMSPPALAHHGNASHEIGKFLTLTGTVTEWVWSNPHCFLKFDVKDEKGAATLWVAETQNPVSIGKDGWSRRSFKPGDQVTVTLLPVKNGSPIGLVRSVTLASGQVLKTGADAAQPQAR